MRGLADWRAGCGRSARPVRREGWGESPIPTPIDGPTAVSRFTKDAWQAVRQRGSHVILVKDGHMATLSVPDHREVAKGTLRSLIRSSGLTVEEFAELAEK